MSNNMKTEITEQKVNVDGVGNVIKKVVVTFDETRYKNASEAVADHEKMEAEQKAECDLINEENKKISEKCKEDNQKTVELSQKEHAEKIKEFNQSCENLRLEYEQKMKELNDKKPKYVQPELKKPELKKLDISKYSGRGYFNREAFVEQPKTSLVDSIKNASPEELKELKKLLA